MGFCRFFCFRWGLVWAIVRGGHGGLEAFIMAVLVCFVAVPSSPKCRSVWIWGGHGEGPVVHSVGLAFPRYRDGLLWRLGETGLDNHNICRLIVMFRKA